MVTLKLEKKLPYLAIAGLIGCTTLFSSLLPLENILSEYPFTKVYPWYVPWRIAVTALAIWVASAVLYSLEVKYSLFSMWVSFSIFVAAHYACLLSIADSGYRIVIGLFTYMVTGKLGHSLLYLDLGQVLAVINLAVLADKVLQYRKNRAI